MRQVLLQLPEGEGARAVTVLDESGATTLSRAQGTDRDGQPVDLVIASIPNASVGPVIEQLERLGRIEATVPAGGVFTFQPPTDRPPRELVDVTPRSPLEVVLAGRQSIGGWKGFLGYAATAGVVVWIGLFNETSFLLTAAMLLAPFAGPAMNTAIGIVSGDARLFRRSVLRYAAGVLTTSVVSFLLTLLVGQGRVTGMAADAVTLSNVDLLLPLAAGVAGALYLIQSEHSSLVSGAAVGVLVAAALAPPAGTVGMAVALGRWDLIGRGGFLLAGQLLGITLTAALLLRLFGLHATGYRYASGRRRLARYGLGGAAVLLAALASLQFASGPPLQRASVAREASQLAGTVLEDSALVELLQVTADVPSTDTPGPPRVIVIAEAELRPDSGLGADRADEQLTAELGQRLAAEVDGVVPLVDLTVLAPP